MDITRRRLLQAVAAAPLVTVPSIVFGKLDRLPTPQEVLANGSNITVTCKWTDHEMMTLTAYCAAFAYVGYKKVAIFDSKSPEGELLHEQVSNFIDFALNNAGVGYAIFGVKTMLTSYRLPIQPGLCRGFDRFHKECGDQIMRAVEWDEDKFKAFAVDDELQDQIGRMLNDPEFAKEYIVKV